MYFLKPQNKLKTKQVKIMRNKIEERKLNGKEQKENRNNAKIVNTEK